VASRSDVAAYSQAIDKLSTVAYAQLKALLDSLATPNPVAFRNALIATYPEMMRPYLSASSAVAAQWYTTLRVNAGAAGRFAPILAPEVPAEQFTALVRYPVKPLFLSLDAPACPSVLTLLAGATQKLIANQGRDTISASALKDPVRVGYARIPRSDACSFCGLLASRGAVYRSEASAGGVVGRGVSAASTAGKVGGQGQGTKARGSRSLGSNDFHNHCRCVTTPVFRGGDNAYLAYTQDHFKAMYDAAFELNDQGSISAKDTLAQWRQVHGTS